MDASLVTIAAVLAAAATAIGALIAVCSKRRRQSLLFDAGLLAVVMLAVASRAAARSTARAEAAGARARC